MKKRIISLFLLISLSVLGRAQNNLIELPFVQKNGYGPFRSVMGGIAPNSEDENNPWKKTYLKVTDMPTGLTDVKIGVIETNMYQSVYQDYFSGNITKEFYESLQKSWNWIPDSINQSKKPLKTKIVFALGKDATGKTKMVVDANNNLDLRDDAAFTPIELNPDAKYDRDSLSAKNVIMVSYERLSNNTVIQEKTPLLIAHINEIDRYVCNFPQYGTTRLDGVDIAISSTFTSLSYDLSSIVLIDDNIKNGKKAKDESIISKNEYIKIKGNIYKNKGVNQNKNVLLLEKTDLPQNQLYSTQFGFKTFDIKGQEFRTKSTISINDYKSKYLLIDFWATWCSPCLQELPNFKALYDKIDKSKVEFLGIVGDSPSDALEKLIDKYSITWPLILSDETNKIKETYGIHSYPTSILINPEGIIVAKDLRGNDLENKIKELIGQ